MLDHADQKLAKLSKGLLDLPSLPIAVEQLIQLSEKEPTPRQLAELIGADQGLTAKVLRLVNSAFYSLRSPIASLSHASSLLGTKTLKSMALSVSVMNIFRDSEGGVDARAFWRHSLAAALVAQKVGMVLLPRVEEDLYVSGLLHDAGVAILMESLGDDYAAALSMARATGRDLCDVEAEEFGTTHAEVGHMLATRWRLPPLVCECIRLHEEFEDALREPPGDLEKAIDIVRFADRWSARAGFDFIRAASAPGAPALPLPSWAGIDLEDIRPALEKLPLEVAERESAFFPA
jgi:HD-like signal output (HDOD) protein